MGFLTPNASGEEQVLATFMRNQLAQVRSTAFGLSDEQIVSRPTVSEFSIGSLLRHVGLTVRHWCSDIAVAPEAAGAYDYSTSEEPTGMTAADLLAEFDQAVAAVDQVLDSLPPLDTLVPVPEAEWFPKDLTHWEVRWVLVHLCTEVARHAGHGDIIRQSIDGQTSYVLNALADGDDPSLWR